MANIEEVIEDLTGTRNNVRFAKLVRVCQEHFGCERVRGSHHIFKTPWAGDPRINLQKDGSKAKPYQVDQVVAALERLMARKQVASVESITKSGAKGDAHGTE